MRHFLVLLHRYLGLATALFLAMAGLTGALLAWYHDLDAAINPDWMRVSVAANGKPLSPLLLRERVEAAYPGVAANYVELQQQAGHAAVFHVSPGPAAAASGPQVDEIYVDPYSGQILGARRWGVITDGWHNLMPFVYRLHYSLALDSFGTWVMGIVALLWTADCFAGAYLTFPAPARGGKKPARPWLARWRTAWGVRWSGGAYKVNYDLHRAGGLWPWLMLLILAWSSVAFNLHHEVYKPVMRLVFDLQQRVDELPRRQAAEAGQIMSWQDALSTGQRHMASLAAREGMTVLSAEALQYRPQARAFRYRVKSTRDIRDEHGSTDVVFDAVDGRLLTSFVPTGKAAGDTLTTWITSLHMAQLWGIPFRLFMSALGVAVAMLSVTGVYIWWKKRKGRLSSRARQATVPPGPGVAVPVMQEGG